MITAEELIAICTAHGVDLKHVAGNASRTDQIARKRKRTKLEIKLGLDVRETVTGRQTRTYRRPTWSAAELGMAAGGSVKCADGRMRPRISRIPWFAAQYSFARDVGVYWELWYALMGEGHRIGKRDGWAPRVTGEDGKPRFYFVELAQLVLDVEHHRWIFDAAQSLYAWYLGVGHETWVQILEERYTALADRYNGWLNIARSEIQREIARCLTEPAPEAESA